MVSPRFKKMKAGGVSGQPETPPGYATAPSQPSEYLQSYAKISLLSYVPHKHIPEPFPLVLHHCTLSPFTDNRRVRPVPLQPGHGGAATDALPRQRVGRSVAHGPGRSHRAVGRHETGQWRGAFLQRDVRRTRRPPTDPSQSAQHVRGRQRSLPVDTVGATGRHGLRRQ